MFSQVYKKLILNVSELIQIKAGSIDPQEIHKRWFFYPLAYGSIEVFEIAV